MQEPLGKKSTQELTKRINIERHQADAGDKEWLAREDVFKTLPRASMRMVAVVSRHASSFLRDEEVGNCREHKPYWNNDVRNNFSSPDHQAS